MITDDTRQKLEQLGTELAEAMKEDRGDNASNFRSAIGAILGDQASRTDEVWNAVFKYANGEADAIQALH